MNKFHKNQIKMLQKLYKAGKFADIPMKTIQAMSYEELEKFIQRKQQGPARTTEPIAANYRKMLLGMIEAGNLKIPKEDLFFMSQRKAEKFYWMGRSPISDEVAMCTKSQYKRLRNMMKEGFIIHMEDSQIKTFSEREAELLIKEGEENILNMEFKE